MRLKTNKNRNVHKINRFEIMFYIIFLSLSDVFLIALVKLIFSDEHCTQNCIGNDMFILVALSPLFSNF